MVLITLVGESIAKEGNKFYYLGSQTECRECRLKTVCFNLEQNGQYEITSLRDQTHNCLMTEETVRVVEVKKISRISTVPKKIAIEGSIITLDVPSCEQMDCSYYQMCHPAGIENKCKFTIVEVNNDINCPIGEKLVLIEII